MLTKDVLILLSEIKKLGYKPNEWEKGFLGNILNHRRISIKQGKILESIYAKATGGGIYQRKEEVIC